MQNKLINRRLRVKITLFVFLIAFIVIVALFPRGAFAVGEIKKFVLHLCLLLDIIVELASRQKVLLEVAVVVITLADFLVNLISLLALFTLELLLLDALDPVNVGLLSLNPTAVVANDVLMSKLRDCLNLLHTRVLQQGMLAILSRVTILEFHVNFYLFEGVVVRV